MSEWSQAEINRVRALWKEGRSCEEIACALSRTKNSVAGKVHRLELTPRGSPIKPLGPGERPKRIRRTCPVPRPEPLLTLAAPPVAEAAAVVVPDAVFVGIDLAAEPAVVAFAPDIVPDRRTHVCEWPLWKPGKPSHAYCGVPIQRGERGRLTRFYCDTHAALAAGPAVRRRMDIRA